MAPGATSKLTRANPRTSSLQAVVPKGVTEQMKWQDGDQLDWEITFVSGQKVVVVKKA
jgi:bifunctional DNA-binding transcriptional regulator/antitoxin component of YhaV-PrlF toxin-antitoxin module